MLPPLQSSVGILEGTRIPVTRIEVCFSSCMYSTCFVFPLPNSFGKSHLSEDIRRELYQKTGAPIHSAYALPQLLDIYDNNNLVVSSIHKWQTIASICLSRWTGATFLPISFSEASWTGLLNVRSCQYEPALIDLLPPDCQQALPLLSDFYSATNNLHILESKKANEKAANTYWERWPELRGPACQLFLGLGDGACANIGSKCSTASRIAVTIGTSAAARVCLPLPISCSDATTSGMNTTAIHIPPGLFCYRIDRNHVLLGGALTDGGSVVEWTCDLLNLSASPESFQICMDKVQMLLENDYTSSSQSSSLLSDENEESKPHSSGLTFLPFLSGERSTGYRDGATGAILGFTRETTPAHLLKSSLEGVTLRLNAVVKLIQMAMYEMHKEFEPRDSPCIVASGKALEVNALWRQMLSDCSALKMVMDQDTEEGTSRGVAIAVGAALGAGSLGAHFVDEPLHVSHMSEPNEAAKIYWKQATDSQEVFLESVSPLFS